MIKTTKGLLEFWEEQMKQSHRSSNYFFRKSPSHYHMMLLIMAYYKQDIPITVEELKTKLFKTSRPKSALIIKADFGLDVLNSFVFNSSTVMGKFCL